MNIYYPPKEARELALNVIKARRKDEAFNYLNKDRNNNELESKAFTKYLVYLEDNKDSFPKELWNYYDTKRTIALQAGDITYKAAISSYTPTEQESEIVESFFDMEEALLSIFLLPEGFGIALP